MFNRTAPWLYHFYFEEINILKKKLLIVVLTVAMSFGLSACGKKSEAESQDMDYSGKTVVIYNDETGEYKEVGEDEIPTDIDAEVKECK